MEYFKSRFPENPEVNHAGHPNTYQWRIQDLPRGNHGERAEREQPKRGSGAEPPTGSRVRTPGGGEAENFLSIFIQKVGKSEGFK